QTDRAPPHVEWQSPARVPTRPRTPAAAGATLASVHAPHHHRRQDPGQAVGPGAGRWMGLHARGIGDRLESGGRARPRPRRTGPRRGQCRRSLLSRHPTTARRARRNDKTGRRGDIAADGLHPRRRGGMSREEEIRQELFDHTLNGHAPEVKALTEEALKLGMDPMDILFKALIPSLEGVGRPVVKGDFFVPEMLIAARARQGALVILRPLIAETGAKPIGKVVIGTVKGDIHDIGKNLVIIMLEGAGFEVVDLGVNCAPEKFVEAVRVNEPHIVGFSAFLTTTMPMFKVNIQALEKAGLRDKVTVMVGGAPVTEEYAKLAGADHYSPDASIATRMAKQIVGAAQAAENAALTQAVELIDKTLKKG